MKKKEAKEVILRKKDHTAFFDKSVSEEEMYDMLRYRMRFGEAETEVIISALVLAGAKFQKKDYPEKFY